MKALNSSGSRIKYQHIALRIPYDLKDMGMSAHEYVRFQFVYELPRPDIISTGITSDMYHEYLEPFALEEAMDRMSIAQVVVVTVSGDADKRLEGRDFLCGLKTASEIAGMPHLVNRSKKFLELLAEYAMRIRYETYIFH